MRHLFRIDSRATRSSIVIVILVALILPGSLIASDLQGQYHEIQRWPVPGAQGWRCLIVDASRHLLFIARTDRITVLDTESGKVAGEVTGLSDARGIALDTNGKTGYVTDGTTGTLHIFDAQKFSLVSSIVIGGIPDQVVFDPSTDRLVVLNTGPSVASVVDARSNRIISTIELPGRPASAVVDNKGSVFVNIESANEAIRIDASTLNTNALSLGSCRGPSGLAMDVQERRLFAVCENKQLLTVDANSGKVLSTLAIGEGTRSVAFDAAKRMVFASSAEGAVAIAEVDTSGRLSTLQTLKTEPGARMLALDPTTRRIYLVSARFGQRPGPTSEELQYRPTIVPGSVFVIQAGI